jgi:serine/threonine-protein kinase
MEISIKSGTIIRNYLFDHPIGHGAYGMVWQGRHELLDLPVAIKVIDTHDLDAQSLERVKQECRIGGQLIHKEHIVEVRDAFEDGDCLFIVMERMASSLEHYLRAYPHPDFDLTLTWALDLCTALEEVHDLAVIHRDIKPQNILLTDDDQVKLSDFGVAHLSRSSLTTICQPGTPGYQAPEQEANQPADSGVDVYSLCAVLFEIWTGRKYFRYKNTDQGIVREEMELLLTKNYPHFAAELRDRLMDIVLDGLRPRPERITLASLQAKLTAIQCDWQQGKLTTLSDFPGAIPRPVSEQARFPDAPPPTSPLAKLWAAAASGQQRRGCYFAILFLISLVIGGILIRWSDIVPSVRPTPTAIAILPTDTPVLKPTNTPTSAPPTDTSVPPPTGEPTEKPTKEPTEEPTDTPFPPTDTPVPLTDTPIVDESLTGKIAFPIYQDGQKYIYLAELDSMEPTLKRLTRDASEPALSPDGSQIAFRSWNASTRGLIVMNVNETYPRRVSQSLEDAVPYWAQGESLVFHSTKEGTTPRLYTVGTWEGAEMVDSVEDVMRGTAPAYGQYPAWVPDGRIVYKYFEESGNFLGLYIMSLDGANPMPITDHGGDTMPSVSPLGDKVAFMSDRTGKWEVYGVNIDGSGFRQLTDSGNYNSGLPTWSPDGNYVAFV